MPRPLKDPSVRQRTNRAVSASQLVDDRRRARVPRLPPRCLLQHPHREACPTPCDEAHHAPECAWHPQALAYWKDMWRSPMSAKWLRSDVHALVRIPALTDRFWREGFPVSLDAELRLHEEKWGLSNLARLRLQWGIVDAPDLGRKPGTRAPEQPDPRKVLRMPQ